jgi:class I lanthipeptide synthase
MVVGASDLLDRINVLDGRQVPTKLHRSLLKYLIRICTRPTPYGLFANVALVNAADQTDVALSGSIITRTRPDMGWLLRSISSLAEREEVRQALHWYANPEVVEAGGRAFLAGQVSPETTRGDSRACSVRLTEFVRDALNAAAQPISYGDLVIELVRRRPGRVPTVVSEKLDTLWRRQLLLTTVYPPLTTVEPTSWAVSELRRSAAGQADADALDAFSNNLKAWDRLPLAERGDLRETLNSVAPGSSGSRRNLIQVDSAIELTGKFLSRAVVADAVRAGELLLQLSPERPFDPLHSFKNAFAERYEELEEVPLAELLHPGLGLGPPRLESARFNDVTHESPQSRRDLLLLGLAADALRDKTRAIELDTSLVDRLTNEHYSIETAPATFDIVVAVAASSAVDVDAGRYLLVVGPSVGSSAAGKYVARFAHLLGDAGVRHVNQAAALDEAKAPDVAGVEMDFVPHSGRQANVLLRPLARRHRAAWGTPPHFGESNSILPSELLVSMHNGRFRVRRAGSDTELRFVCTSMLNMAYAPPACRFLEAVCRETQVLLQPFDWGTAEALPYLPRVQIGRIVLRPAQWQLPGQCIQCDDRTAERMLLSFQAEWNMPSNVQLGHGDQRLYLDLDRAAHRDLLLSEARRAGRTVTGQVVVA